MNDLTRRYLIDVRPSHLETFESYSARLLTANFEDITHRRHLARLAHERDPTATPRQNWMNIMTAKSGRDLTLLDTPYRSPIARPSRTSGPLRISNLGGRITCTLCTHGDTVHQHPHFEGNICVKHHRWIGPATTATEQHTVSVDAVHAELKFRRLRQQGRIDVPFYSALKEILNPSSGHPAISSSVGDALIYPQLIALATLLTSTGFGKRFFNPARTYAQAYALLTDTVRGVLDGNHSLIRTIWLYFRPTFLSIRKSILSGHPYQPETDYEFLVTPAIVNSFDTPQQPLEPFPRYLHTAGRFENTESNALNALVITPLTHAKRENPYLTVTLLCPLGHSCRRSLIEIKRLTARGTELCRFCAHTTLLTGFNDLTTTHPDLARQFSPKNDSLTANQVFAGSAKKYWWRCAKGHDFEATASNRSSAHSGCPVCLNRVIIEGVNDIGTLYPHLAAEWHPDKNINHRLETLAAGSNVILWWLCKEGHTYRASLEKRSRGAGCHTCINRRAGRRTIASARPDLAAEWHPNNYPLTPEDVTIGSRKDIEWVCPKGHVYTQRPERRNVGYGCNICSGRQFVRGVNDAMTRYPDICAEWHPSKNCFKEACDILPGNSLHWWKCKAHGHETHQSIPHRVDSNGCTLCPSTERVTALTH